MYMVLFTKYNYLCWVKCAVYYTEKTSVDINFSSSQIE